VKSAGSSSKDITEKVIAAKLKEGEQIMYVRQSRKNAESSASEMIHLLGGMYFDKDAALPSVKTDDDLDLERCVKYGIAYHHAGVSQENRSYIEERFKKGR